MPPVPRHADTASAVAHPKGAPDDRRRMSRRAGRRRLVVDLRTPAFTIDVNPDRNVLLVTIDTLRADALGAYGGRAATPNLDRLAAHGARFTFAHAHAVVTLSSHATILTGRYPYEHGIRDNTGYRLRSGAGRPRRRC